MFTLGRRETKYVYPSLFFLFLLFLLLLRMNATAAAAERVPDEPKGESVALLAPENGVFSGAGHSELDFISAVDSFNEAINPSPLGRDLAQRWTLRENAFRYGGNTTDMRYGEDRRMLDQKRNRDLKEYREKRRELENDMLGINRESEDYDRLAREMNTLDRRYMDRESGYRREYLNLDTDYVLKQ